METVVMQLTCAVCGKPVSSELPDDIIIDAYIECKDCSQIENANVVDYTAMESCDAKADRVARAIVQEQNFVRSCRDPAFRVCDGKDTDCIVFRHDRIEIVDNKFTDDEIFYVGSGDVDKGLDIVEKIQQRNLPAAFATEIWFPRHKRSRVIQLDESNRGHTLKIWIAGKKIMSSIV